MGKCINPEEMFHVHTWRCKHAGTEREEEYIQSAIWLKAKSIVFSDHAPFPGNPFRHRMSMQELSEYEDTLWELKKKYTDKIDVRIGLEIEYLPSFRTYYEELKADKRLDFLMLGQHFSETGPRQYTFLRKNISGLSNILMESEIEATESGVFSYIAHPDRVYRYLLPGEVPDASLAKSLIERAKEKGIPLEKNLASIEREEFYQNCFWGHTTEDFLIGLDAHSVRDLRRRYCFAAFLEEKRKEKEKEHACIW